MTKNEDNIQFGLVLKFTGVVILIIAGLMMLMQFINDSRNRSIVNQYTEETNRYIQKNQAGLETLFSSTFAKAEACNTIEVDPQEHECREAVEKEIYSLITTDLTNFSSTFFIRLNGPNIQTLNLSGYTTITVNYSEERYPQDIRKLLRGDVKQISYDKYYFGYGHSQVIVPVIINNKIIGGIARGVIEEQ